MARLVPRTEQVRSSRLSPPNVRMCVQKFKQTVVQEVGQPVTDACRFSDRHGNAAISHHYITNLTLVQSRLFQSLGSNIILLDVFTGLTFETDKITKARAYAVPGSQPEIEMQPLSIPRDDSGPHCERSDARLNPSST
ncbi:hypothetical protein CBL_04206 [Carabus blaptoides fortunei]